jgi:hypothetical protein
MKSLLFFAVAVPMAASAQTPTPVQTRDQTVPSTSSTPSTQSASRPEAGQVWVNLRSHIYYCYGSHYYGRIFLRATYMSEADAKAAGNRPSRGNACS